MILVVDVFLLAMFITAWRLAMKGVAVLAGFVLLLAVAAFLLHMPPGFDLIIAGLAVILFVTILIKLARRKKQDDDPMRKKDKPSSQKAAVGELEEKPVVHEQPIRIKVPKD